MTSQPYTVNKTSADAQQKKQGGARMIGHLIVIPLFSLRPGAHKSKKTRLRISWLCVFGSIDIYLHDCMMQLPFSPCLLLPPAEKKWKRKNAGTQNHLVTEDHLLLREREGHEKNSVMLSFSFWCSCAFNGSQAVEGSMASRRRRNFQRGFLVGDTQSTPRERGRERSQTHG